MFGRREIEKMFPGMTIDNMYGDGYHSFDAEIDMVVPYEDSGLSQRIAMEEIKTWFIRRLKNECRFMSE